MLMLSPIQALLAEFNPNDGPSSGFFLGSCIAGVLSFACFVLWIWALVDAIKNPRLVGNSKVIWVLLIVFLPFIGSILYLVIGRK